LPHGKNYTQPPALNGKKVLLPDWKKIVIRPIFTVNNEIGKLTYNLGIIDIVLKAIGKKGGKQVDNCQILMKF